MRDKEEGRGGPQLPTEQHRPPSTTTDARSIMQQQQQQQQQHQQRRRSSRQGSPFYVASASDGAAIIVNSNSINTRRRLSLSEDYLDEEEDHYLTSKLPPNIHKKSPAELAERDPSVTEKLLPQTQNSAALFSKSNGGHNVEDFSDMSLPVNGGRGSHHVGNGKPVLSRRLSRTISLSSDGGKGGGKTSAFGSFIILALLLCSGYFLRDYVRWVLVAAESQDDAVLILILTLLYAIVSLPLAWGYILINIATGYLYGVVKGTIVTILTVTLGVFLAHHLIRAFMSKYVRRWIIYSSTLSESLDAVMSSKKQAFKIVLLSRLTPVPFGLQNAIFAVNCPLSTYKYLQATMIGLLPCQVINAYLGSTFRSMEQLLNNSETTQIGGIILGAQLAVAVAVTYFVVKKAKSELDKSLKDKLEQEEAELNGDLDINIDLDMVEKGRVVEVPEKTSQLI